MGAGRRALDATKGKGAGMTDALRRELREIWDRRQRGEITDQEATQAMYAARERQRAAEPHREDESDA